MVLKIQTTQQKLNAGISIVSRAIDSSPQQPILGNILFTMDEENLFLTASNGMITLVHSIDADVEGDGEIALPAKLLKDLVNKMSREKITLDLNQQKQTVKVKCGHGRNQIRGIDANEFPYPFFEWEVTLSVERERLLEMMTTALCSVADRNASKPALEGVLFEVYDGMLRLIGADGFRMSLARFDMGKDCDVEDMQMIIPASSVDVLRKTLKSVNDDMVDIAFVNSNEERQVAVFETSTTTIYTTLLSGEYPDINSKIPDKFETQISVERLALQAAAERVELFARDEAWSTQFCVAGDEEYKDDDGNLVTPCYFLGISQERGRSQERINAYVDGKPLEVTLNIMYVIHALKSTQSDDIVVGLLGAAAPITLVPILDNVDEQYIHMVMPMASKHIPQDIDVDDGKHLNPRGYDDE